MISVWGEFLQPDALPDVNHSCRRWILDRLPDKANELCPPGFEIRVVLLLGTVCPRHLLYPVEPSCATSRGRSPIRNLGTRVAAVVPQHVSQSLTQADTTSQRNLTHGVNNNSLFALFKIHTASESFVHMRETRSAPVHYAGARRLNLVPLCAPLAIYSGSITEITKN